MIRPVLHSPCISLSLSPCLSFLSQTSTLTRLLTAHNIRPPLISPETDTAMARGNQRDKAREANLKKQAAQVSDQAPGPQRP